MNDNFSIGQFGEFIFTKERKNLKETEVRGFDIEGAMITDMDNKYIWLLGTDGQEYLVEKKRVKQFVPMKAPLKVYEISIDVK